MSIKDKITPGKWKAAGNFVRTKNVGIGYEIGTSHFETLGVSQSEANAKLWAASKEMLDILERLVKYKMSGGYTPLDDPFAEDAINLLKKLNNE